MAEHTPGAWRVRDRHDGIYVIAPSGVVALMAVGCDVQNRINACLIASAPDLLAALEGLLPMADALLRVGRAFSARQDWMVEQEKYGEVKIAEARAAIARARGEA